MARNSLERRLERLVTTTFNKAFRSGVQPVEVARRLVRELESATQVGVRGTVAPNVFTVSLASDDGARFANFGDAITAELIDTIREHALERSYRFVGPVTISLQADPGRRTGDFAVHAEIVEGGAGWHASLRLPDGRRIALGAEPTRIGRLAECEVQLSDPKCSRQHAEIRAHHDGHRVHDLQSTNGTLLNDTIVIDGVLHDGDEIRIGESIMRYEES